MTTAPRCWSLFSRLTCLEAVLPVEPSQRVHVLVHSYQGDAAARAAHAPQVRPLIGCRAVLLHRIEAALPVESARDVHAACGGKREEKSREMLRSARW